MVGSPARLFAEIAAIPELFLAACQV